MGALLARPRGKQPAVKGHADKVRVLEVLATLKRAGAERTAVTLAGGLDRGRFETEVVSLYDAFPDGFEPELAAAGVPVHYLGKRRGFDPRVYPRLRRVMRSFGPAIVHTHSYVLRYAWPVSSAPVVHTVHNVADREVDRLGRWLHRLAMGRGVCSIAISREVARSFRTIYGTDADAVIPNGVDLAAPRTDWRQTNGFSAADVLIVSVARLDPQKNPLLLIDALPDDPRCHLLLAGDGTLLEAARKKAGPRVHFLGVRSDIPDLLAACDLFALASDYEGLPVAVIEAMAAGLPVIATKVGGVPELVEDNVTGILVPPRDRGALAGALAAMVRDPARRGLFGACARERARQFSAGRMIESYGALFERIAGGRT
jgi:glycosyltransferase involved in cell wall biosynthesis